MSDIVDRLRGLADLFEAQHAPHNLVLHVRAGADEIERLRAGGCARDQGTTQYCAEAARLAAENERLRAALERIAKFDVPREVGHTFRSDGVPSKHDKCLHGETMYDECAPCMAVFANAALTAQPAATKQKTEVKLNINAERFLAAVDREGDHEIGVGLFAQPAAPGGDA